MRLRTELPSRPMIGSTESSGDATSPRTKVSDQLKTMKLELDFSVPVLDFGKSAKADQSIQTPKVEDPGTTLNGPAESTQQHPASDGSLLTPTSGSDLARPQTPVIQTTLSPQDAPQTISPLPLPSPQKEVEFIPASPSARTRNRPVRPSRAKSPPPTSVSSTQSDLVWTAAEITGHDPDDPADDGRGVNGIGFRPTPAIAQARAQKRRQQVAEWKSREAREARQRRLERRKGLERALSSELVGKAPRRVRFVEG